MTVNFKIISFNEQAGTIEVKYSDKFPPVSIDIPLNENGLYLTGDELNEHIKGFIPFQFLDRIEKINQGISNLDEVRNMVESEPITENTEANRENAIMWQQISSQQALAQILVKWGVLDSDPTQIPVATQ